jgi:O-antigen/teichoic acid export membrane protein
MNSLGLAILNKVRGGNVAAAAAVQRMNRVALTGSTAAVALLVAVCGPFILRIFGSDFAASDHSVLWILLASTIFESALLSSLQPIQAAGRMWLALVAIAIPWQAVFVASAYLLIPRFAAALHGPSRPTP